MFGEPLPSWLTTSNSLSAVRTPAAASSATSHSSSADGYYGVGVSASPAVGAEACLVGPELHLDRIRAAHWEIEGLYWTSGYVDALAAGLSFGMRGFGTKTGAYVQQGPDEDSVGFYVAGETPRKGNANVEWRTSGEASKRRNVGFLLISETKEVLLTDSGLDRVVGYHDASATMALGAVRPFAQIGTADAAQKIFRFANARLTIWRD